VTQVPAGAQTIEITMIGYAPSTTPVVIIAGETLNLRLALEPLPLETVTVMAGPDVFAGMGGFEERKARGSGRYFTREEIVRMQARQVTDVLRRVPGMQIESGREAFSGGNQTAQTRRTVSGSGSHPCSMTYYVNGSPFTLSGDISINHFVAPDDIAAIEVYTGSSQIPPQFNSSIHGSRCGVVAIWTRSSLDAGASR
jgi:outer membrane receptor for ferrienterochelin and colicin